MNKYEKFIVDISYNEDVDMYYCDDYLPTGIHLYKYSKSLKMLVDEVKDYIKDVLEDEENIINISISDDEINWNDKNNPGVLEVSYSTLEEGDQEDFEDEKIEIEDDIPDNEELIEIYYDEDSGYTLFRYDSETPDGKIKYCVSDDYGEIIDEWESAEKVEELSLYHFLKSQVYKDFKKKASADVLKHIRSSSPYKYDDHIYSRQSSIFDYDDFDYPIYGGGGYHYTPPKKSTGFLDKLNKSDTLVIHCQDRSTDMLSQIYEGKGWDVLRDGNIDKDELHQLLQSHDKIVMLGHGTPSGLMNIQGSGYVIGDEEAKYLKDKKIFAIWCYASSYFDKHGIGKGYFITKNTPSESWESRGAGCGNISRELMLENITYWSKLCADIVDQCLSGNGQSGVDYLRKNYLEKYGNHPVTIFNADSAHIQGSDKPLPKYEFKGKPLTQKDYPTPDFNEEEFLKNPSKHI